MPDPANLEPRRGDQRYRCALAVALRRRGTDEQLLTSDVSFRGAHVRTDTPPPMNSLVRLVFTLPPDDARLALSAHVTRLVGKDDGQGEYPGFVVRFVGLDGAVKERWESLISWLRSEHAQSVRRTVTFARPSYVRLFQQKASAAVDLWMRPVSVEELLELIEREIPQGHVLIPTTAKVAPGLNVTVRLVHPITEDVFALPGVVRRRGEARSGDGVLVALEPLSPDVLAGLTEMAESVVVLEDYDVELYEEPSLES